MRGPIDVVPRSLMDVFADLVRAAADRGELVAAADPDHVATVLYSSCFGLLYDWCEGTDEEPPFDLQVAFMQFLDVILNGLCARSSDAPQTSAHAESSALDFRAEGTPPLPDA